MERLRISAKNLGYLSMPDFCPRCFWLKMHMKFKMPLQIFPGIFSSIDSYSKKITNLSYEKSGKIPEWFSGLDLLKPIKSPSWRQFNIIDEETNIQLTGIPDEMFERNDGSYFIADYKTARFTAHQDHLLGMYIVQLNGYARIAEQIGYNPVTGLSLIYYEPVTDITTDQINRLRDEAGFLMGFSAHVLNIELEPNLIPGLMRKARELYDLIDPPESKEGCKDCDLLDECFTLLFPA